MPAIRALEHASAVSVEHLRRWIDTFWGGKKTSRASLETQDEVRKRRFGLREYVLAYVGSVEES